MTPTERPAFEDAFRNRLKEARKALGLTQVDVARRARAYGFEAAHQSTIAHIEAGSRGVGLDEAAALAWSVDRTLADMIARDSSPRDAAGEPNDEADEYARVLRERGYEIQLIATRGAVAEAG